MRCHFLRRLHVSLSLTVAFALGHGIVWADDVVPVSYNRDIRPILSDRCFPCHGPDEEERSANLRLDRADGPDGAYRDDLGVIAIKPGDPEASEVWNRITSDDSDLLMPPPDSHQKPLDAREQELLRQWIAGGAVYEDFWAFTSPKPPELPAQTQGDPIDQLIGRRLSQEGLSPSARAEKRTLIRRLSFSLTGLPPTREEIQAFLEDETPEAYERLVDRLLDSPHFGEHLARYWLDLVRFADTNGIHHDHYREMSPYRDWVIRAFNANLPYDEFVRYQIAGDLYPNPSQDQLIASGFHRLHLIIDRGTALPEESFTRNVIDRVTSVGTAFLGMTFQCAVCHDHKYDPITMRDFYSLSAYFNNIDADPETGGRSGTDFQRGLQPPYINLPSPEQADELKQRDARVEELRARVAQLKAQQKELSEDDAQRETIASELKEAEQTLKDAQQSRDDLLITIPAAMVMKERTEPRPTHILIRGQYDRPGQPVQRGTPSFLPPLPENASDSSRIDLADWLVAPSHPLTARVTVNRFWQQLFGVGLVRTSEDFGMQGEWPSHLDLLDYLSIRFVESGWDIKALLKEIVMSQTYQQTSAASPEDYARDPLNRLLARGPRFRMDAEMVRDQILASSGLLNPDLFGKSVKPPQPEGLWKAVSMPSSYPHEFVPDTGEKIYRRSLYTFWKRGMPPPQMTIFNAPSREECIARRERTNTPLQALLLLNEAEYLKAARHLSRQILAQQADDSTRVNVIYETITSQQPTDAQRQAFLALYHDLKSIYEQSPELANQLCEGVTPPAGISLDALAAWTLVSSAVYNLDITKTQQ